MGIKLVQNIAAKAQSNTGDGTTTACLIAAGLCNGLAKYSISDVHSVKKDLEKIRDSVLNSLAEQTRQISDNFITDIATIASNNDEDMGLLISQVIEKVGRDGIITVNEGNQLDTTFELTDGLEIDEGYFSHLMANDPSGICELTNPVILATNKHLINFADMLPALELASSKGRPILIFAKAIQGSALNNTVMNIVDGRIQACIVKAPNFGDAQLDELGDIVALMGGKLFSDENNDDVTTVSFEDFGTCEKAIITSASTTLVGGEGDVRDRVSSLKLRYEEADSNYDKSRLQKRMSRLQGGVAVITVGAGSSIEMRETKERLDDAINATKAALSGGIIVGGGLGLANATTVLDGGINPQMEMIVTDALLQPIKYLSENHSLDEIELGLENTRGFNALSREIECLLNAGVIDPAKVTISSFTVAMSIATLFLTTDVAVLLEE
jgi:chaperonin GroEL